MTSWILAVGLALGAQAQEGEAPEPEAATAASPAPTEMTLGGRGEGSTAAPAPAGVMGRKHKVVPKDCMWDLAKHYYGDHFKWRRIADANPPPDVKDPHWIYPDQILIIPDLDEPVQAAETTAPEEAARMPAAEAKPVKFVADKGEGTVTVPEALSTRFPEGLVAMPPSNYRMKALGNWVPDGEVAGFSGTEIMAAEGDLVDVMVKGKVASGDRFSVYRRAAPTEADVDKTATYVVKIGLIQVRKPLPGGRFRAVILKSNDSVQVGDLLVRGE